MKDTPEVLAQRNWAFWALGDTAEMRKGIDKGLSFGRTPDSCCQDGILNLRAGKFPAARPRWKKRFGSTLTDIRALSALHQSYAAQKTDRDSHFKN